MEVKHDVQNELEKTKKSYSELELLYNDCLEREKNLREEIRNINNKFEELACQKQIENDLKNEYENLSIDHQRIKIELTDTANELTTYKINAIAEKKRLEEEIEKYNKSLIDIEKSRSENDYKEQNENLLQEIQDLQNELTNFKDLNIISKVENDQIQEELEQFKKSYAELEQLYKTSLTKEKLQLQELNDMKAIYEVDMMKIKTSEEHFKSKYENLLKENEENTKTISNLKQMSPSEDGLVRSGEKKFKTNCEELTDCDLQDSSFHSEIIDGYTIFKNLFESYSENVSLLNKLLDPFISENKTEKLQGLVNFFQSYEDQMQSLWQQNKIVKTKYFNSDMFKNHVDNLALASLKESKENLQKQLESKTQEKLFKIKDYIDKIHEAFLDIKHSATPCVDIDFHNNNTELNELNHLLKEIFHFMSELKSKVIVLSDSNINIITEKNQEIERLAETSDQLSQEVLEKSQTIKEYENEIAELSKNNDLLIADLEVYKNNHLETISEIDEDKTILLEEQLEKANAEIEELKIQLQNTEKQQETMESKIEEEDNSHLELLNKHDALQIEYEIMKRDYNDIEKELQSAIEENSALNSSLESMRVNTENLLYIEDEIKTLNESLQAEIGMYKEKIDTLTEINEKLKSTNEENEELKKELFFVKGKLNEEENDKKLLQTEIKGHIEKLNISEMNEASLKSHYDTLNKEYLNTIETVTKLKENLKDRNSCQECQNLKNKIEELKIENGKLEEFKKNYEEIKNSEMPDNEMETNESNNNEEAFNNLNDKLRHLEEENVELKEQLETLKHSQTELIQLVTTKHQENVAYHTEIQRLTQMLTNESQKCVDFETQINSLNQIISNERKEREKVDEENTNLKEQCDLLSQSLLEEQAKVSNLLEEKNQPSEAEMSLKKKLERLQTHLVELEEHYTNELYEAEQKNSTLQLKVNEIEEREKISSTMYTSVSIRANQQVESLQSQLLTMTNERDSLRRQVSDLEDTINKQSAALTNLQLVLEQFRKDKEKEVHKETERLRRQINTEKKTQDELKKEIVSLKSQLEESKQGLLAASRLSDQLEISRNSIATLKEEVHQLQKSLASKEEDLKAALSQTDGKVDKSLMKNLIIGFVTCNNNLNKDQSQILKIIGTVLDFDQLDHDKLNMNKGLQGSWLGGFLSPQTNLQNGGHESLSRAFIEFLEKESKPRVVPSLLNTNGEASSKPASRRSSTTRQTPANLTEIVLPTFADFAQSRNSSSILKDVLKDHS